MNDKTALGFSFIGAGLKTEYNQTVNSDSCNEVNNASPGNCPPTVFNVLGATASPEAGVELYQMQFVPSIAYKVNKAHSFGASIVLAANVF